MTYTRTIAGRAGRSAPAIWRAADVWPLSSKCRTASRVPASAILSRRCFSRVCSASQLRLSTDVASASRSGSSGGAGRGTTAARRGAVAPRDPSRGRTMQVSPSWSMATDLSRRSANSRAPRSARPRSASPRRAWGGWSGAPAEFIRKMVAPVRPASQRSTGPVPPLRAARCMSSTASARRIRPTVAVSARRSPCISSPERLASRFGCRVGRCWQGHNKARCADRHWRARLTVPTDPSRRSQPSRRGCGRRSSTATGMQPGRICHLPLAPGSPAPGHPASPCTCATVPSGSTRRDPTVEDL